MATEEEAVRLSGHLTGAIGAAFVMLLNALLIQRIHLGPTSVYPSSYGYQIAECPHELDVDFDFIIVGGGTAGCVLANRLSQHNDWNILLLEAGDYPSTTSEVPAMFPTLVGTNEEWNYVTEVDKNICQGMKGKRCRVILGKTLGGTSTINNMHWNRANRYDLERWENEIDDEKWDMQTVNFFYERLENYKGEEPQPFEYGNTGDVYLDVFNNDHYIKEIILDGAKELKYEKVRQGYQLGYVDNVVTIRTGCRFNMAKAFLTPIKKRTNLYVVTNAFVSKLLVPNSEERRVKGVEVTINKKVLTINAKKEVILTAGPINTPKILMYSGIGPKEHLKTFDIPVLADLPVGFNLQGHFAACLFVTLDPHAEKIDLKQEIIDATYLYVMHRRGPLANTNINDLVGFLNTRKNPYEFPNIAVYHYFFQQNDLNLEQILDGIGYEEEIIKSIVDHNKNNSIIAFMPVVLKPNARGRVLLNDTNPKVRPLIDINFLSDDGKDYQTLLSGFKFLMKLVETEAFQERGASLLKVDVPNCRNFKFCSDAYVKCIIQNLGFPLSQFSSTIKIGEVCDKTAVVNTELYLKGFRGLRIVDGSVMPEIISGNIQGTVAMIADRISELIKAKWIRNYIPEPKCICKYNYNL